MDPYTLVHPLLCEASLVPGCTLPNYCQRSYVYRLVRLLDEHSTKEILLTRLRVGYEGVQLEKLPNDTLMWTKNTRPTMYRQWLAWQLTTDHSINSSNGAEPVSVRNPNFYFKGKIIVEYKEQVLQEVKKNQTSLVLWTDGSKLEQATLEPLFVRKKKRLIAGKRRSSILEKIKKYLIQSYGQFLKRSQLH